MIQVVGADVDVVGQHRNWQRRSLCGFVTNFACISKSNPEKENDVREGHDNKNKGKDQIKSSKE